MAVIVYINTSNGNGNRVLSALRKIQDGLSDLREMDGLRAESIGAGQATMASNFGAAGVDQAAQNAAAQALSDRWGALLAAYADSGNAEYAKLRDMLNATTAAP